MATTPTTTVSANAGGLGGAAIALELMVALVNKGTITKAEGDAILQGAVNRIEDPNLQQEVRAMIKSAITNAAV